MRGGKGLNNMDEPVRHGPRSLFVPGTVTGVADHNHSRAGPRPPTILQRPPPPVSTVSPLGQAPLELAPLAHRTSSPQPSAMASMGSTGQQPAQPSSTPTSAVLYRPPSPPLFLPLPLSFCSSPGPCAVSVPGLCQSSPFLVATDTFGCNPIHSSC